MYLYWYYKFKKLGFKLNIEIWLNQFGPGLSIAHGKLIFITAHGKYYSMKRFTVTSTKFVKSKVEHLPIFKESGNLDKNSLTFSA